MTLISLPLLAQASFWLEPQASTSARQHDLVFYTVLYVTGFFFLLVVGLMLLFIVLYRRRRNDAPADRGPIHNTPLELFWTSVPLAIVLALFGLGMRGFMLLDTPPGNAEEIDVEAKQWGFTFTYPNGAQSERLYAQIDRPVVLKLHSADVTHSVYIPAFRIQRNAVPGRTTELWFQPTRIGTYLILCTQYCGDGHSRMTTEVEVLDPSGYRAKLAEAANIFVDPKTKQPLPYAEVGQRLYRTSGCSQCHTVEPVAPGRLDGKPGTGPTWLGLFKRDHEFSVAPPGYKLLATDDDTKWDAYFRESILDPGAKIVAGFQNVMPPAAGQFSGTPYKEKKLAAIIEYIKSLDNNGPGGKPKYYHPMPLPAEKPAAKPDEKPLQDGQGPSAGAK